MTSAPSTTTRPDVRIAERAGFCYGVRLAIDKAKHAREEGKEVTTLGQLVHNPGIKADLSDRPAHDLGLGLSVLRHVVLTGQRLGTILTRSTAEVIDPH